ncbi:hypothetical protein [Dactylosporangium sp. CS-033363]|uniref:hypothetical protein n=1 Tax=Dactylosporangium sp. CS-033363 TaxID=3239935 RepID=UPI003D8C7AB9
MPNADQLFDAAAAIAHQIRARRDALGRPFTVEEYAQARREPDPVPTTPPDAPARPTPDTCPAHPAPAEIAARTQTWDEWNAEYERVRAEFMATTEAWDTTKAWQRSVLYRALVAVEPIPVLGCQICGFEEPQ